MRRQIVAALLTFVALGTAGSVTAGGDAAAGKEKSVMCASCHGADGAGMGPNPALKGMDETAFYESLMAYKSGDKDNAMMQSLAQSLTDQDMKDLAAYYATMQ